MMDAENSVKTADSRIGIQATLALAMLLAALGSSIANVALPTLITAFSATFAQVQSVVTSYLAGMTVAVLLAGRLGDRHGLRPMLIVGLTTFAAASLLCAVAPTLRLLVAARALQGVGAAFLMVLAMALMRQTADPARIGRAMGMLGTVSAVGTALGPSLGGLLIPLTGWQGIFVMQVPLAALALMLALRFVPRTPAQPVSAPLRFQANRNLAPNLIVNLLVAAVMMTTLMVGPFYLGLGLGLTTMQVGLVMTVGPAVSVICGVLAGHLIDTAGSRPMLLLGLILLATGAVLMTVLPERSGVSGYVLAIIVLTPGYQLFQAANNTAALAEVPAARRGTVSGLLNLSRNIGLMAGSAGMGAIFALGTQAKDVAHASSTAISAGMQLAFMTAGGMMVAAIMIMLRDHRRTDR